MITNLARKTEALVIERLAKVFPGVKFTSFVNAIPSVWLAWEDGPSAAQVHEAVSMFSVMDDNEDGSSCFDYFHTAAGALVYPVQIKSNRSHKGPLLSKVLREMEAAGKGYAGLSATSFQEPLDVPHGLILVKDGETFQQTIANIEAEEISEFVCLAESKKTTRL